MKRIAYVITDNGVDGREPTSIVFASFSEAERDMAFENDKAKSWHSKAERIVESDAVASQALARLDGIERLALNLPQLKQFGINLPPKPPRCPVCNDDAAQCPKTYSGGNVGQPCPF